MARLPYPDRDYAFGRRMLTLRDALGLTQSALAEVLGVSRRAVGDWEAGDKYPKPEHLKEYIALAVKQGAFTAGREPEEIRALWEESRQRVILDKVWLTSILRPAPEPSTEYQVPDGSLPTELGTRYSVLDTPVGREAVINLPFQPTPFYGRISELAEIAEILGNPACRLLTLVGPGGAGKTRLAIEAAENQVGEFTHGVVFVGLASVGTSDQIVSTISEALGISFSGQIDHMARMLAFLRDRNMLLVLDNFEHLLEGAGLVSNILQSAPRVTLLVTSRERLNMQTEWLFDVEGLSYPVVAAQTYLSGSERKEGAPEEPADPADYSSYSAVQLFVQRARQVQPGFVLTDSTLASIVHICQQVAGMPLAIELAAAAARTLSIPEIEQQIGSNLDVLATTLRDVPARHRSMRAAIDQSWNLLSEPERALFSRMSVFRGGCTAEAAEQIAGATLPMLEMMAGKSLIRQSPAGVQQAAAREALRFSLLEPIREYALDKLRSTGEAESFQRSHAIYYTALAEEADAQWDSPATDEAAERLDRDYDNIRTALRWAGDSSEGGDPTLGLRLGVALRRFWQRRGYYTEGRAWLEELLARQDQDLSVALGGGGGDMAVRASALHTAAWLASDQHDYARAIQLFEQSRELRRSLGETEGNVHLLAPEARQARAAGDYRRAVALREDALAHYRTVGDRGSMSSGGLGLALYELALVVREQGDFERATALFEEFLALHRELSEREGVAIGLMGLGDIARDRAEAAKVREYCEQSLAMCRELGVQWAIGFLMNDLALAAYLENDLKQASTLIEQSVAVFRASQADSSLGEVLITHAHILRAQGDATGAYEAVTDALRLAQELGPRLMVALALECLAGLAAQRGAVEAGVQALSAAAAMREQMGTPARPLDRILQTHELAGARSILGDETYEAMWGEGRKLRVDEIRNAEFGMRNVEDEGRTTIVESSTPTEPRIVFPTQTQDPSPVSIPNSEFRIPNSEPGGPRVDWGEALAVPAFYGREWELGVLSEWVVEERCRVVTMLGLGGIGKSALAVRLMHRVAPHFDVVIWRSLRNLPTCDVLLEGLLRVLATPAAGALPESLDERLNLLLKQLRSSRVLLVLDNLESVLEEGEEAGRMRAGYEGFGQFLRRAAETEHRSCLLLTSREKPGNMVSQEGGHSPVRNLRVGRLDTGACEELLAERGVTGTNAERARLIEAYASNPLALKIVAQTIVDLFEGEIGLFLEQGEVIYGSIRELLGEQFARLSTVEQQVLLWLAIMREPATLDDLIEVQATPVGRGQLLEGIEALWRRSLVERGQKHGSFTLQSVVLEYATARLIGEVSREICDARPHRMIEHGLELAQAREYVRETQERLILAPVLEQLRVAYPHQASLDEHLRSLLAHFATLSYAEQGYGPANVVTLLRLHRGELHGIDLSGLALRGVYLQGVDMRDTSLAGAAIQDSIFTETFDAMTAVAISSNGAYWAAASRRGEIRVWDTATSGASSDGSARAMTLQGAWRAHADMVWALAFSPDERTLASGSWDGTVKLWDAATRALIWSGTHASHVNRVAFSPDGSILASSSIDATVRLWDVGSGRLLKELLHPDPVCTVSWSPHGDLLASGDIEGRIRLWDIAGIRNLECGMRNDEGTTKDGWPVGRATHVRTIQGHTDWVDALAFSPDERTLASGSWDGTVKLWEVGEVSVPGSSNVTPSAGVEDRRERGEEDEGDEGDEAGLKQTLTGHTDRVGRIAWSPDGRTLASGSRDRTIRLWDVEAGNYRAVLQGHTGSVYSLAFTPEGGSLLTSSEDGTLRVWDNATGQCIRVMLGYTASLYAVDWSPDSTQLVSGGTDSMVVIYDVTGAKPGIILRGHTGVVIGVAWSPDGRWIASSEWDNAVRVWDPNSGACAQVLRHPGNSGNCFYGLAWRPIGQVEREVRQPPSREEEPPLPMILASGTYHYGVQMFDLRAQQQHWEVSAFQTLIRPVAWSPNGKRVAGGGDDGTVYVWDAEVGTPAHTPVQRLPGMDSLIRSVAWSPDGTMLASSSGGTDGGEIFLWDMGSGERVAAFHEHSGIVYAVAWGPDEDLLVSGGGDGTLRWWDVQSGECLWVRQAHEGTVQSLRRSPDGTRLASCGDDGAIMIWDLRSGEYLKTVRRDRPYERLNIAGIKGLTEAQVATLRALGAIEDNARSDAKG